MRPIPALVLAAALALRAAPACADDMERSRQAFKEGARVFDEGRAKEALTLFQEAYRLHPSYATRYNIGLCERALGHPVEAAVAFQAFIEEGGNAIPREKVEAVTRLVQESQGKIARLAIEAPKDAALSLDGRRV